MIFAVEFKRHIAGAGILGIVVDKLRPGKKPCPIILLKVDESSKICFHHTILLFGLPVRLGVESGREFLLDA